MINNLLDSLISKYGSEYNIEEIEQKKMPINFNPNYATLVTDDFNQHALILPNGQKLYGVIKTLTNDSVGLQPQCEVTLFCNILSTEFEAKTYYKKS